MTTLFFIRNIPQALALITVVSGFGIIPALAFTPSTAPTETQAVPGNMLLALSVEYPTGLQVSYTEKNYSTTATKYYDGYFDNKKCYAYDSPNQLFTPQSARLASTSGAGHVGCAGSTHWSGNVLNWLTMTNLDQFRAVLTGGTRDNFSDMSTINPGDNASRTVLIRSFSDRNEYNPEKTLPAAAYGVPIGAAEKVRSGGYGSKFFITSFPNVSTHADRQSKCSTETNGVSCFNIRVEVCKYMANLPNDGRETNCVGPYGTDPSTYYKPQGLIQEYASAIRFGAMGYLNEDGQSRNGGVLRAVMKSVGATKIGEGGVANPAREWDASTGFLFTNPDPADATATNTLIPGAAVTKSGVINYLNQFGYTSGYKANDPVSELYYASQLYFRNQSFPAEYTSNASVAGADGFPVITSYVDPMIKSCQKNFILGIGDTYTHCDGNLPGSNLSLNATCGEGKPTDGSINVTSLWDSVMTMEGITSWVNRSTGDTPFMAGLAWWANVNDIRPTVPGKQTISTYWVDVLEKNNGGKGIDAKSQYWLAAKYGGFRPEILSSSTDPNTNVLSWDKDRNGQPDTLYAGNNPAVLTASLRAAFDDILSRSSDSSASSAAVTSNRQTSSSQVIYAGYNPKDWTGTVRSCALNQTAAQCAIAPIWEVSRWFDSTYTAGATPKLNATNRKIFTSTLAGGTFSGMPFLWSSLDTSQQVILDGTDSRGSDRVSYLRGSRALEGATFRARGVALMGDVVNSNVTYLAGSGPTYRGSNFTGHSTYRAANAARGATIYVGANDGMLHAFSATDGKELWGYIPGSVFASLPSLTSTSFSHHYFVDGTAMVGDTQTGITARPWRTMLVGALGGGGRGYFALDVSRQTTDVSTGKNFTNMTEAELATIPMWEFTSAQDADLGFTFNEPSVDAITSGFSQIAKVADATNASGAWRIIVGNGYGSSANKAALFFLDSETGAVSTKLVASTSGTDNGLSSPTPVDTDNDGLIDTIYAGDLQGKLHKFQFSKLDVNNLDYILAPAQITGGSWRYIGVVYDTGTPITTAPVVTKPCNGTAGWQILFGTGKLIENTDFTDITTNGFYAIIDNNVSSELTVSNTLIADISYTQNTLLIGTVRNWNAPSLIGKKGWKISFTGGERIISNPTLPPDTGAVLFGTAKPSGDICEPGSSGFLMSVNICNAGIGGLTISDGTATTVVGGFGVTASGVLKLSNTYTNANNEQVVVCNQPDCQRGLPPKLTSVVAPRGRYSWRELLSR